MKKQLTYFILFLLAGLFIHQPSNIFSQSALEVDLLTYDYTERNICDKIEKNLRKLIENVNAVYWEDTTLSPDSTLFTGHGYLKIKSLIESNNIYFDLEKYTRTLIKNKEYYQVRDISVHLDLKDTKQKPVQYLILDFDNKGKLADADYGGWSQFDFIGSEKVKTQKIKDFIDEFLQDYKTAYQKENYDYIEKIFSDDALIIVGKVLRDKKSTHSDIEKKPPRIVLEKRSKHEYLTNLKNVFDKNEQIIVEFDNVEITQKNNFPDIYGVTLLQKWWSSSYHDQGWLFLMLNMQDENKPVVVDIRTWHPGYLDDRSPFGLNNIKFLY